MYRIGEDELSAISRVFQKRELFRIQSERGEVDIFEEELSAKMNVSHSLCVSGGTGALICALAGMGIGPGDEVIVPGYTFMATAIAVLAVGAIPVICEVDETLTLDPVDVERKLSKYTKAIIPVHMVGFPCDMAKIVAIAAKHEVLVLEDACQAIGGKFDGKYLGTIGDAGAYSFNHYKTLTSGEGGCLVTDETEIYHRALVYHDGGATFRPYSGGLSFPTFVGAQYRASEIIGAILRIQLGRLDEILADLRRVRGRFTDALKSEHGLTILKSNDSEGDCATTLGFIFDDAETAEKFAAGVGGWLPINSDKHVYTNWTPILEKRGAHHPALNPYNHPDNKGLNSNYSKDMCPKTLDLLSRVVFLSLHPDWTEPQIDDRIERCRDAVKSMA